MRITRQKKWLKEEVEKFTTFFNAEELYQKVSKRDQRIGIATVYRFLKNLVDNNKLHSFSCEGKTIYSLDLNNHCHFICQKCGNLEHLDLKKVDFLPKGRKNKICHFQIDLTGTCEKCLKKE